MKRLDNWVRAHKSRSVNIKINGSRVEVFWEVQLQGKGGHWVCVYGAEGLPGDTMLNQIWLSTDAPLEKVITAALDCADRRGL